MPTLSSADTVLETQVFWYRHKKEVFAILILALLTVAGWGAYRLYSERRDTTAANVLAAAKTATDFQKIIAQFPGTPAAGSAYLFLAEEQRKEKKFSEANATLQAFVDKYPKHELKGTARMAMAGNLESLGRLDEALAIYQRLVTDDPESFIAPAALMAEVPILKAKNQVEEARHACETILTKYRDRFFSSEAQAQLRLLKPPAPEAPPPKILSPEAIVQNLVPSLKMRPSNLPATTPSGATSPAAAPPVPSSHKKSARPKKP
jgi:predicted negative regulator of RcsB-dependent stress response